MLAFVLSRRDFREYDQSISLYTLEKGRLEVLARGVKKILSKNAAHLEPFCLIEAEIIQGKEIAEEKEGYKKIVLSPNDLVYVPSEEEIETKIIDWNNKSNIFKRTYKMVSSTGGKCEFVPHNIAKTLLDKIELGSGNKNQRAWDGIIELVGKSEKREDSGTMIKNCCIKLKIDRIGNIEPNND